MPKQTKPGKLPTRTVHADEVSVTVDGVEYFPHVGETVTFRPASTTFEERMLMIRVAALESEIQTAAAAGSISMAAAERLDQLGRDLLGGLLKHITAWTLTDDGGEPYPLTVEAMVGMRPELAVWLRETVYGKPPEAQRDDS